MITKDRYHELIEVVNAARPLYMQGANTGISDELYDSYMNDIYEYEKWNRAATNSPTRSVNPSDGGDVVHPVPMLSLKDVFTITDTQAFMDKFKAITLFSLEHKLDGLSVQLIYRDGKLVSASTRGDGHIGVECIAAAQYIADIPKTIPISWELIVHGEVFMKKSRFEEYCKKYGKQANPRNTAVGIFKRQNELERAAYLSFSAYNIDKMQQSVEGRTQMQDLGFLMDNNFPVVYHVVLDKWDNLEDILKAISDSREELDIPIDGMVVKFNNIDRRSTVGDNGVVPNWAVAYKFPAQEQETRLKDIEWQVGSTGRLNPVAILEPVLVMGSTISKATLHNWERIKQLGVQKNDMVVVYKAGDIIPAIKSTRHTEDSIPFEKPTVCPACGEPLTEDAELGICSNIQCREKLLARLNGWTDKKIGNFKGVAGSLVEALYERGKLRVPADFYKIKPIEIMTLPGSGKAKMNTYLQRVEESKKNMTFAQILVGLGINNLAQAAAQSIETYFKTNNPGSTYSAALYGFAKLPCATLQDLIGKAKGESVYNQLQIPFIQEVIAGICEIFSDRTL
jgi:DNA ligase (NAD+)